MRKMLRHPWFALALLVTYSLSLGVAFLVSRPPTAIQGVLAFALAVAGVMSFRFPVHVAAHIKLYITAPALFTAAVVLAPDLACLMTLTTGICGNILIRQRNGLLPIDIASEGLRWGVAGALAGILYHLLPRGWQPVPLIAAAVLMYAIDIATISLLIGTLDGRSLRSIVTDALDNWRFEGAMYLIGGLGALDANYQPWALILLVIPSILIYRAVQHSYELQGSTRRLIEGLADTVDVRDWYSAGHSKRVAAYAEQMVSVLRQEGRLGPIEADLILTAARVHDVGKIEIPDAILHNPDSLTSEQQEIMASHIERGAEILQCYPNFRRGVPLIRHHHERWDGTGYPHRLAGHNIPLGARIIAIANEFDALTSEHLSRPALTQERAAAVLRRQRGEHWDPELVDIFIASLGLPNKYPRLQLVSPQADAASAANTA